MKLKTKLILFTDSKGEEIDIEYQNILLVLNGEKTEIKLHDIITEAEFDEGEVYGNTLLSYYEPQEDGSLHVPGSIVQLIDADTGEHLIVKRIVRPNVNDDTVISFDQVKQFAQVFKISKPDEVFTNLNDEEKQFFIDERNNLTAAETKAAEAAAKAEADKAEAYKQEQEKLKAEAEKQLRESIDPDSIQEKKQYQTTQAFYDNNNCKEYIAHPYHLFFGKDSEAEPALLIKRGETWWQECADAQITDETDKAVTIEFTDLDKPKQLTLNIESGEINVTDI